MWKQHQWDGIRNDKELPGAARQPEENEASVGQKCAQLSNYNQEGAISESQTW